MDDPVQKLPQSKTQGNRADDDHHLVEINSNQVVVADGEVADHLVGLAAGNKGYQGRNLENDRRHFLVLGRPTAAKGDQDGSKKVAKGQPNPVLVVHDPVDNPGATTDNPGHVVGAGWNVEKDTEGNITAIHATYDPESKGGTTPDGRKVKGTSHWVSASECISAEVRQYDKLFKAENPGAATGNYLDDLNPESLIIIKDAKIEKEAATAKPGDYLQFIRNGYYMADCRDSSPEHLVFNRTVTLKDSWSKMKQKMGL